MALHQKEDPVKAVTDDDYLLTLAEVAQKLGLNERGIRNSISQGIVQIEALHIGVRTIRFRNSDVQRVIRGEIPFTDRSRLGQVSPTDLPDEDEVNDE